MGGTTKAKATEAQTTPASESSSVWDLIDYGSNTETIEQIRGAYNDATSWLFDDGYTAPDIAKADTTPAKTSVGAKQDETMKDVAKGLTSMPTIDTNEVIENYSSKTSVSMKGVNKDELIKNGKSETAFGEAESSTSTNMSVGPTGASLGASRTHELTDSQDKAAYGGSINSNGVINAGADVEVAGIEVGVNGMLDVGTDGLEGAGAGVKLMGTEMGVSARFGKTTLDGSTVSWSAGMAAEGSGDVGSVGASVGVDGKRTQSITFPTEEAAAEFYAEQGALDIRAMSAEQIAALGPDVRLKYSKELAGKASGKMGGSINVSGKASEDVEIENTGEALLLKVTPEEEAGAGFGVGNGILEVVGKMYGYAKTESEYRVDLNDPSQMAAYDRYRETGDIAELELAKREDRSGWGTEMIGSLGLGGWSSSGQQSTGTIEDDSGVRPFYEGISGSSEEHWDPWRALADGAEAVDKYTLMPTLADPLVEAIGDTARAQEQANFADYGSRTGEEKHMMRYIPSEKGDSIEQSQTVNYADRAQVAAFLRDQTTMGYDANAVSEYDTDGFGALDPLRAPESPLRGKNDRAYTLESVINAEGTANIREALADEATTWDMELEGSENMGWIHDELVEADNTTDAFGHSIMDAAYYGGDDAMEGFRQRAEEHNVEQFLSIEGDSNWLSQADNLQMDDDFHASKFDPQMRASLAESERARLDELQSDRYPEVPKSIKDAEIQRIRLRLADISSDEA